MRGKIALTPELVARVERTEPDLGPEPGRALMTDGDYARACSAILNSHAGGDLWIFAYGSLLWRPGFEFVERKAAILRGWHRAFCILLKRFRGTPEQPGLMLALDHGGSCRGAVLRLASEGAREELEKLLRREVPFSDVANAWRWVEADISGERHKVLTFYAGIRRDDFYVRLPIHAQAHMLARAAGHGGSGAAYLQQTVVKLEELGIHDRYLWQLQHMVAHEIHQMFPNMT
jgi:cation transport protein ChaC